MARPGKKPAAPPPRKVRQKLRNMLEVSDWAVFEPPDKEKYQIARVYVNYGIECGVRLGDELIRLKNRRQFPVVAGDLVYTDGTIVEGILPRGKVLARYADEAGVRVIASQLDQVGLVVSASTPPLHEGFIDRYLVYCRIVELPLLLVLNKMDEAEEGIEERLEPYTTAGVDIYKVSALSGQGMKSLEKRLKKGITVLSGLSGVGKSTLINELLGEDIPTAEVSESTNKGRHTTTVAEAYEIGRTLLIDTPGIKKFGFIGVSREQVLKGFPEMIPHAESCRFDDCLHIAEKDCGVLAAVEEGMIDARRHRAYCELIRTLEEN